GRVRRLVLLEQEHRVDAGAAAERTQKHLRGSHTVVVAEPRRLVHHGLVTGPRVDGELDLLSGPARRGLLHRQRLGLPPSPWPSPARGEGRLGLPPPPWPSPARGE